MVVVLRVRRVEATAVVVVEESTVRRGLRTVVVVVVCLSTTPSKRSLTSLTFSLPLRSVVPKFDDGFALFSGGFGTSPKASRLRLTWAMPSALPAATPTDLALVAAVDAVARARPGGLTFSGFSDAACVEGGFARDAAVRPLRAVAFSLSLRTVVRPAARVTRRV